VLPQVANDASIASALCVDVWKSIARNKELKEQLLGTSDLSEVEKTLEDKSTELILCYRFRGENESYALKAFLELRRRFDGPLRSKLGIHPRLDDVLQETWISVWKSRTSFEPGIASFERWLSTIGRNKKIDLDRAERKRIVEVKVFSRRSKKSLQKNWRKVTSALAKGRLVRIVSRHPNKTKAQQSIRGFIDGISGINHDSLLFRYIAGRTYTDLEPDINYSHEIPPDEVRQVFHSQPEDSIDIGNTIEAIYIHRQGGPDSHAILFGLYCILGYTYDEIVAECLFKTLGELSQLLATEGPATLESKFGLGVCATGCFEELSERMDSPEGARLLVGCLGTSRIKKIMYDWVCQVMRHTRRHFITIPVATPTFKPLPGRYIGLQDDALDVTINCATSGATIRYTTNGRDPTKRSPAYCVLIHIASTTTLKARGYRTGWKPSDIISAVYTITKAEDAITKETPLGPSSTSNTKQQRRGASKNGNKESLS